MEEKKYVPDNVEWSKHQADFFRLTGNDAMEGRHLDVAAELTWLRKDLTLAMVLLNKLRIAEQRLMSGAEKITNEAGEAGHNVNPLQAAETLREVIRICEASDAISEQAITYFNSLKLEDENGNEG